ncbi:hypothetical protein JWS13_02620 (plasmid) [Rhodococcus pseudokoreensis]|uniref:Colicin import membrane protein n=1 Tax=Rhodococcus pseudokoreensis TaxID=2811421 RepID=A0A974ZRM3_9NOCA|nr:hypothetical protein [Rhodococcus pseudokoreensis]QSE87582.1 hypothetical protein JWS13_02620 [Rhodococcus pseudokoreensis]
MTITPAAHKKAIETARKNAEALAQKAIETRVALVGAIGEAVEELAALDSAREAAVDAIRMAHENAIEGGWTAKELAAMGYTAPKKRKNASSKAARGGASKDATETTDVADTAAPQEGDQPPSTDGQVSSEREPEHSYS